MCKSMNISWMLGYITDRDESLNKHVFAAVNDDTLINWREYVCHVCLWPLLKLLDLAVFVVLM